MPSNFGGQKGIYVTLISIPSTPTHRTSYHVAYKTIFTTLSSCGIYRVYEKQFLIQIWILQQWNIDKIEIYIQNTEKYQNVVWADLIVS